MNDGNGDGVTVRKAISFAETERLEPRGALESGISSVHGDDDTETTEFPPGNRGVGGTRAGSAGRGEGEGFPSSNIAEFERVDFGNLSSAALDDVDADRRYRTQLKLGSGGMGEVMLCRDARIGRDVAVKRIRADVVDEDSVGRFLREVRVQGQLEHPAVVPVYDLAVAKDGLPFFTMKRVRGRTLEEVLAAHARGEENQTFGKRKLLTAFSTVCLAVDFAHKRGVLHRDLKPANIMLGDFGEVHVLDWGLAKLLHVADESANAEMPVDIASGTATQHGLMMGTPGYMSPEQCRGELDQLGPPSDVFALGAILYEILSLRALIDEPSTRERVVATALIDMASLEQRLRHPAIAPSLRELLLRALAPKIEARISSARELADAIDAELDSDREQARRGVDAAKHVALAQEHSRAYRAGNHEAYMQAVQEFGRALAIEPTAPAARDDLTELLLELPQEIPSSAKEEYSVWSNRARSPLARTTFLRLCTWLAALVIAVFVPVIPASVVALPMVLIVSAMAYAALCWQREWTAQSARSGLVFANTLAIVALSMVFGPFLVLPALAATHLMFFVSSVPARFRALLVLGTTLAVFFPALLAGLGLGPEPALHFTLENGQLHVHSPIALGQYWWVYLVAVSVAGMITPALLARRIHEQSEQGERHVFMQGWYLRHLLPSDARKAAGQAVQTSIAPRRNSPSSRRNSTK